MTLVDTSAWVEFLRHTGSRVDDALSRLLEGDGPIATMDFIVMELLAGAVTEGEAARLHRMTLSLDRRAGAGPLEAEQAARLFRICRQAGEPLRSPAACLVAAVALRDGIPVLAADPDFGPLARHAGLRLSLPVEAEPAASPGDRPRPDPASRPASSAPEASAAGGRLLIVEDDPDAARLLEEALRAPGREIEAAATAREARDLVREHPPDVIVLDLILPDADGRVLLSELRRTPTARRAGIVVVTGRSGPGTRAECFASGAAAFFPKPVDPDAVSRAVNRLLERSPAELERHELLAEAFTFGELQEHFTRLREAAGEPPSVLSVSVIALRPAGRPRPGARTAGSPDPAPAAQDHEALRSAEALRAVLGRLLPMLREGEVVGRSGPDQLILLSPVRPASALGGIVRKLRSELAEPGSGAAVELTVALRDARADEDFLDAVTATIRGLAAPRPPGEPPGDPDDAPAPARPRAVLVEDDPVTSSLVRHRLEKSGFEVACYADGAEGLDAVLAAAPAVAILDVQLPSMGGFEILGRMKQDPRTAGVPTLVFTTLGRQEHVTRAFELGADDYVTKPFSPGEFLTRVLRLVRTR